jgi:uncharacterized protein YgiM (DUF1202 family)
LYSTTPMRTKTLLSVAIAGLLMVLVVPVALAERVKTTQATRVMKRPGEQSAVVARVQKGQTLTVIATQGRWMKVRANGRTGWVARSTVQEVSAREVPRNTRRRPFVDGRSTRRGWSGEAPDDRVGGDAIDDDDDDEDEPVARRPAKKAKPAKKAAPAKKAKKAAPAKKATPAKKSRARFDDDDDDDEDFDDDDDCDDDDCDEDGPAPKERVVTVAVAKTKLRAKPTEKGRSRARVREGARLVVLEQKGAWMLVEDTDGDTGWIRTAEVFEPGMRPDRAIRVDARVGFDRMSQVFRSDGGERLANYDIGAAAAAVSLRADVVQKYGPKYLIGGELRYDLGKSTPGIRYTDGTNAVDIAYTTHDVDARLLGGYDFHHPTGAAAFARLGYHYGMFAVADVSDFTRNLAKLPSETLAGPTVGLGGEVPRITDQIGARAHVDYLVAGSRAQTVGLEDGAVSTAGALWASLVVHYQWKPDMTIDVAYGYDWSKTVWTGAAPGSMRGTGATQAARKDVAHGLLVGLAKTF